MPPLVCMYHGLLLASRNALGRLLFDSLPLVQLGLLQLATTAANATEVTSTLSGMTP